jgi:hypothetical protein
VNKRLHVTHGIHFLSIFSKKTRITSAPATCGSAL